MWDDGLGSKNADCTASHPSGCWTHRHDVLWKFHRGALLAMGAAAGNRADRPGLRHARSSAAVTVTRRGTHTRGARLWPTARVRTRTRRRIAACSASFRSTRHMSQLLQPVLSDPDTVRFTRIPEPVSPDAARRLLQRAEEGRADGTREGFAIVDDAGAFLGLAVAPTIDRDALTAELGYMVASAARGRGVATEGLRQLTEWAFGEGMLRLELLISSTTSRRRGSPSGAATSARESCARPISSRDGVRTPRSGRASQATDPYF